MLIGVQHFVRQKSSMKSEESTKSSESFSHHDNASSQTAHQTADYLEELMTHCPYSPYLSPDDFSLLPSVKGKMRRQCFFSPEEVVEELQTLRVSEL